MVEDKLNLSLPVDHIEPNNFNPNVMAPDEFARLKEGMKETGPDHILAVDRILVSPKRIFYKPDADVDQYVIIDGENRWRAAKELGWSTVPCTSVKVSEDLAKAMCYRRNKERGSLDPLKEALLFHSEINRGKTQEQVAKKYNVTRVYLANRLRLVKLDDKVVDMFRRPEETFGEVKRQEHKETVETWKRRKKEAEAAQEEGSSRVFWQRKPELTEEDIVPRGTMSPSHLEAMATLPSDQQIEVARNILENGLSVAQTVNLVKRTKEDLARATRFREALAKAKRKKCPQCGATPEDFNYQDETRFKCPACYSSWDYMKSRKEAEEERITQESEYEKKRREELTKRFKEAKANPSFIRLKESPEELHAKVAPWVLKKLQGLTELESVKIQGKRGEETVEIEYDPPKYQRMNLTVKIGEKQFGFVVEGKDYKQFDAKSRVDLHWSVKPSKKRRDALKKFFAETVENTEDDPEFLDGD